VVWGSSCSRWLHGAGEAAKYAYATQHGARRTQGQQLWAAQGGAWLVHDLELHAQLHATLGIMAGTMSVEGTCAACPVVDG
jgi:hypothetical protein